MQEFWGLHDWGTALTALVMGTAVGSVVGLVPGIGGRMAIILTLPLAATFDPYPAAIYLFALHSVVNTSASIPAIAFGVPTSAAEAATVVDSYPLAKMGRAGEALGASLSASAIGGVLGALAFLAAIPIARPLVTSFGPPELLMLALFGITMISSLSNRGLLPGLIVAAAGAIFAMVGLDFRTGEQRFTFGSIDLWDGLQLPALVCGIFVIPEMLSMRGKSAEAHDRAISTTIRDVYRGMFVTLRYKALLLRSTLSGILVGAAPALGSTVGVWIAYAYAARTTKTDIPFGQGAIAGVIAPEAANNSKEGGAMIPTLLFAIPGSSSMAVMMAALAFCGVAVGPRMLTSDIGLSYSLTATVVLANLLAVPLFFAVIPWLVRLSALRMDAIAPLAIAASVTAAMIDEPRLATVLQIFAAAALGIALKIVDWPRGPFILGYVIEQMAENAAFQTVAIWGWSAFQRPITLALTIFIVGWILFSVKKHSLVALVAPKSTTIMVAAGLLLFFAAAILLSIQLSPSAGLAPITVSVAALALCAIALVTVLRAPEPGTSVEEMRSVGLTGLFILATPIIGLPAATAAYTGRVLFQRRFKPRHILVTLILLAAAQLALLSVVVDLRIERDIIGRLLWALLGS